MVTRWSRVVTCVPMLFAVSVFLVCTPVGRGGGACLREVPGACLYANMSVWGYVGHGQ